MQGILQDCKIVCDAGHAMGLTLILLSTIASGIAQEEATYDRPKVDASLRPCQTAPTTRRHAVARTVLETDGFGVRKLYPTAPGGREWFLPSDAERPTAEWASTNATKVSEGVFHNRGQVRMTVMSPPGKAWWRNVEMTGYIRYQGYSIDDPSQKPHWEWYARGERHSDKSIDGSKYNDSVPAPAGTATPPGYASYKNELQINPHCLGSAYHGNIYPSYDPAKTARVKIEKEISHTAGYTRDDPECALVPTLTTGWFGFKVVIRNFDANRRVKVELWLDKLGNNEWNLVESTEDAGNWWADPSREGAPIDGCYNPPFLFTENQVISWAGPWATFRSDNVDWDFKSLSVREILPIP